MKFAKELDQDLVPEWRAKYLIYKTGKKKIKAISRALNRINQTPKAPILRGRRRISLTDQPSPTRDQSPGEGDLTETLWNSRQVIATAPNATRTPGSGYASTAVRALNDVVQSPKSPLSHGRRDPEREPLRGSAQGIVGNQHHTSNYGSILSTPSTKSVPIGPPSLELPDPALSLIDSHTTRQAPTPGLGEHVPRIRRVTTTAGDAYEVGRTHTPSKLGSTLLPKHRSIFHPRRTLSTPHGGFPPRSHLMRRVFSGHSHQPTYVSDVPLESYKEFDMRQAEFFTFLDKELQKIEVFYKTKEDEAAERLEVLRDQLHEMRDRRVAETLADQQKKARSQRLDPYEDVSRPKSDSEPLGIKWLRPLENAVGIGHAAKPNGNRQDESAYHDFSRRPQQEVPYRVAKRKLKLALTEFYRGLELLKSYALLNRTAFRKINKKYDKAVQARPTGRYMSEWVNKAWFVQSELLDNYIVAVEDLYTRYFEHGNHKIAVGKLRSRQQKDSFSPSVFRNGICLAAGIVLGVEGIVYGARHLESDDEFVRVQTNFLLQIYGGYFLCLLLFLLFCFDCRIWVNSKINYVFIFEFDTRHNLDWRQLSEIPCFLSLLAGLAMWLNFQPTTVNAMFLYWPVVLIGLTLVMLLLPVKILYHRSRLWWAYSNFRLLLAGLYPVEFRDFLLGDMFCSLTYAMGNIEVFFCLYAQAWNDPPQCNSRSSRLLGFFTCLPGIWRALQCLRRYRDTHNAFPHLVNFGKYMFTIFYYMTLSLYRIHQNSSLKALFVAFAIVNSIYVSLWDVLMDWSLGNPYAQQPFLRDVLGYKQAWVYYAAMLIDPVLRFNWIFYVIFSDELQHSAVLSFFVGFSEILRRGMWSLFRVENEHCTNVGRFRASRDVPLPYEIVSPTLSARNAASEAAQSPSAVRTTVGQPNHRPTDLEDGGTEGSEPPVQALRRRRTFSTTLPETPLGRGLMRVGTMITEAHAQDFERKKRTGVTGHEISTGKAGDDSSDDEDYLSDTGGEVDDIHQGPASETQNAQDAPSSSSAEDPLSE